MEHGVIIHLMGAMEYAPNTRQSFGFLLMLILFINADMMMVRPVFVALLFLGLATCVW